MAIIVIICSSLFVTADVIGQNVVLLPYDRAYSQSACRDGLRHGEDKMVFTALVNFTHLSEDWSRTIRFHSTDDQDQNFTYLCAVNLTKGCNRTHRIICYCNTTDDDGTHHIIINITALSSYSHSGLQAYLVHSNQSRMYSGIQRFPKVSDITSVIFQENVFTMASNSSIVHTGDNQEEIKFCCSELPSPCTAAMEVAETLVKGDSCVVYNLTEAGVRNAMNLTLRFDVCGSEMRSNTYVITLQQKDRAVSTSATAQVTWTGVTDYVDLISADRSGVVNTTEIAVNTTRYIQETWVDDQKNSFIVGLSVTTATFVLLFLITTVAYCCRVRLRHGVYNRRDVSNTAKISEFGVTNDKCLPLRPLNPPDDEVNIYDVIPDDFGYQNQPPDLSMEENFRELSETARERLTQSARRSGGYPPAPWPCGAQAPLRHTPLELQIDEYLIPIDLQSDPPSAAITHIYNPHLIVEQHNPPNSTKMGDDASVHHYSKVILHTGSGEVQRSKGHGDTEETVDSENGYITPIDVAIPFNID